VSGPGRPPIGRQITVRIPDEQIDRADRWAAEHDTTRPDIIRDALVRELDRLDRQQRRKAARA